MAPRPVSVPGEREPSGTDAAQDHDPASRLVALMRRSARGDEQAFAELYDMTSSRLYGLVIRVVRDPAQAAEVTQDCYLQIWQNAARFEPERGSVLGWMMTLAHRRAVDRVRSAQSGVERDRRYAVQEPQQVPDVSEAVVDRLEAERVRKALDGLTTMQREAIELAYYGGYTHTEVAGLLDIPLGTAKTRVRDGLIRLRDFFEGERQ